MVYRVQLRYIVLVWVLYWKTYHLVMASVVRVSANSCIYGL
jgi:hypothetical protein